MMEISDSHDQMHTLENVKKKVGKEKLTDYELLILACESILHTFSYDERDESNTYGR